MTTTNDTNVTNVARRKEHNAHPHATTGDLMLQMGILCAPPGNLFCQLLPCAPNENVDTNNSLPTTNQNYAPTSTSVLSLTGTKLPLTSRFPRIISHRKTLKINAPSYTACKQPPLSTPWESPTARTPTPLQFHLAPSLGYCKTFNPQLPQTRHGFPQKPKRIIGFLLFEYELSQSHLEIM